MTYAIRLTKDDNGTLLVSFPAFPEAHTFGDDEADAVVHARDALVTVLEAYVKDRRPLPTERPLKRGERGVSLPDVAALKLALYVAMRDAKMTKTALARKLGWHMPQVDRLFDLKHQSRLDQLQDAARALGRQVRVQLEAAS